MVLYQPVPVLLLAFASPTIAQTTTNALSVLSSALCSISPTLSECTAAPTGNALSVLESALSSICSATPTFSGCAAAAASPQTFTVAPGVVASGDVSTLMIGSTTLTVGGPAYTSDGITASLAPSGLLSIDGTTTTLPGPTAPASADEEQTFTLTDGVTAVGDASSLSLGGTTLTPGAVYTTGSLTVSLGSSGFIDVNGVSSTLPSTEAQQTAAVTGSTQTFSIAPGIVVTGQPSAIVFGSSTLTPGGPPATSGTDTISLGSSGVLVFDGTTTTLSARGNAGTIITTATSTMTTTPPGLSLETLSGTQWTSNTLLTTTDDSSSTTVVPVIVPCLACEAIIVWGNLPIGVDFSWAQLPQLPKFRLPCLLNCDSPPVNDGPPKSPDPTTGPDPTTNKQSTETSTESTDLGVETQVVEVIQISLEPTVVEGSSTTLSTRQTSAKTTLDTRYSSGIETTTVTTTITGSDRGEISIPTPVYDDFNTDAATLQFILAVVSEGEASEASIDAATEGATSSGTPTTAETTTSTDPAETSDPAETTGASETTNNLPPVPTNTDSAGGGGPSGARCWQTIDPDNYAVFSSSEATEAINSLLSRGNTLTADQTFAYAERASTGSGIDVTASVGWAEDQTGCAPKKDMKIDDDDNDFQNGFVNIEQQCVQAGSRGGDFVWSSPSGCVYFELDAPK